MSMQMSVLPVWWSETVPGVLYVLSTESVMRGRRTTSFQNIPESG